MGHQKPSDRAVNGAPLCGYTWVCMVQGRDADGSWNPEGPNYDSQSDEVSGVERRLCCGCRRISRMYFVEYSIVSGTR